MSANWFTYRPGHANDDSHIQRVDGDRLTVAEVARMLEHGANASKRLKAAFRKLLGVAVPSDGWRVPAATGDQMAAVIEDLVIPALRNSRAATPAERELIEAALVWRSAYPTVAAPEYGPVRVMLDAADKVLAERAPQPRYTVCLAEKPCPAGEHRHYVCDSLHGCMVGPYMHESAAKAVAAELQRQIGLGKVRP